MLCPALGVQVLPSLLCLLGHWLLSFLRWLVKRQAPPLRWIRGDAQPSGEHVGGNRGDHDGHAGQDGQPPCGLQVEAALNVIANKTLIKASDLSGAFTGTPVARSQFIRRLIEEAVSSSRSPKENAPTDWSCPLEHSRRLSSANWTSSDSYRRLCAMILSEAWGYDPCGRGAPIGWTPADQWYIALLVRD